MTTKKVMWLGLLALGLGATVQAAPLPVIPGAAGFGITTPAGRGGKVFKVTTLSDAGTGSLRSCIEASGPRVCVFEVSGVIKLGKDLRISNPYITIAGQTAPSPGITLQGGTLRIYSTHDVLVQHIAIRVGDSVDGSAPINRDAVDIAGSGGSYNIVLDHVSMSWALDELMAIWTGSQNITVRNSIFSEALDEHQFAYTTGNIGKGPIIGPDTNNIFMSGNLLAHNAERNPRSKSNGLVFANNVVYDYANKAVDIGEGSRSSKYAIVGNVFEYGPSTSRRTPISIRSNLSSGVQIFVNDNQAGGSVARDGWSIVNNGASFDPKVTSAPIWPSNYTAMPASQVMQYVQANAGARPADRDVVDARIIQQLKNRTGRIIDSPNQVGGWPKLANNTRRLTLPQSPNGDDNGNGYTNLEEWLHAFAREVEGGASVPMPPEAPKNLRVDVIRD
ncbi:MAG TPA: right-handed parallel beta-helix repeat-containing protein [Gammaproteobacteria bacterium]|nr:right-handed parallel beta-helix repeat-containing protein [Gammaproteobacteria bacterium]